MGRFPAMSIVRYALFLIVGFGLPSVFPCCSDAYMSQRYPIITDSIKALYEPLVGYCYSESLFSDDVLDDKDDGAAGTENCETKPAEETNGGPFVAINPLTFLANGDCISKMAAIPDNSVDLILTDPPYNLGLFMKKRGTNLKQLRSNHFSGQGWDDLEFDEWTKQMDVFFKECHRVLKKRGNLIMFMSIIKAETLISIAENNKFYYKTVGIWHKTNPMPRNMNLHFINSTESWLYFVNDANTGVFNNEGKPIHDFIETATISAKEHKNGNHPTQKPVALMKHFVDILSNPDGVVLDPFMGSGSTGMACKGSNRLFIGIELSGEYYNNASIRLNESR